MPTSKTITVADLKDQIGMPYPRPVLRCFDCGAECSGNLSDYFLYSLDFVFVCCEKPMKLVVK